MSMNLKTTVFIGYDVSEFFSNEEIDEIRFSDEHESMVCGGREDDIMLFPNYESSTKTLGYGKFLFSVDGDEHSSSLNAVLTLTQAEISAIESILKANFPFDNSMISNADLKLFFIEDYF